MSNGAFAVSAVSSLNNSCSFRLMHEDLDPAQLTAILGMPPSQAHRRGETRAHSRIGAPWKEGLWLLESPIDAAAPIDVHLTYLLDRLGGVCDRVRELVASGYRADFFCGYFAQQEGQGPTLSPALLQSIAAVGAHLSICFYLCEKRNPCNDTHS